MNTLGHIFKVTSWGESHGKAIGAVVDGCPSNIPLNEQDIQPFLDLRKPGQSDITTPRKESDKVEILSGTFNGRTTGAPIMMLIPNANARSGDYSHLANVYRPGHADYTYEMKYGNRDFHGGGRTSARITSGYVAAGAIARKILAEQKIEVLTYVKKLNKVAIEIGHNELTREKIYSSSVRCPDPTAAAAMETLIRKSAEEGDSVGGIIETVVRNVPVGLGSPVFHKLNADLAHAMLSVNGCRGIEFGAGFAVADMSGSEDNDNFYLKDGRIQTETNHCGGILGGISTGMDIVFRMAMKPTPSISKSQKTVTKTGEAVDLEVHGRHDPSILPRAVPVIEAMTTLVICDHWLLSKTIR